MVIPEVGLSASSTVEACRTRGPYRNSRFGGDKRPESKLPLSFHSRVADCVSNQRRIKVSDTAHVHSKKSCEGEFRMRDFVRLSLQVDLAIISAVRRAEDQRKTS